ncbi:ribonuclease H-like protein [Dendrothele bispora CBS 962.96]|uniref:RNA exonuclease 4 n=1 Tax=Dendrothele bispora (strain CBS 962.96) TaxID=1314807 RepID=A0A4S8LMK7_DENBC|nr:ribonuclease H-like protein [Dendrothele bispora CBS 962.96]
MTSKVVVNKGGTTFASSNWLALQKKISKTPLKKTEVQAEGHPVRKKRKLDVSKSSSSSTPVAGSLSFSQDQDFVRGNPSSNAVAGPSSTAQLRTAQLEKGKDRRNGESLSALREMVEGKMTYSDAQKLPGKYLALDCEMVGVGIDGTESSLARVSLVNFHGAVIMDEFVKQRERVVDYRTQWSGVRESDMIKAKPFDEIQKQVAELIKDRILVGHAIYNDLKALLLSHPRPLTRDTQHLAGKHKIVKSKYAALRNLVKQELDITIQGGEHSSLTDARATMAVYRLHRKEWEKGNVGSQTASYLANVGGKGKTPELGDDDDGGGGEGGGEVNDGDKDVKGKHKGKGKKRKATADDEDEEDQDGDGDGDGEGKERSGNKKSKIKGSKNQKEFPGGGRKGVSSGLSTVVKRKGKDDVADSGSRTGNSSHKRGYKNQWWKELGSSDSGSGTGSKGSKFSLRL